MKIIIISLIAFCTIELKLMLIYLFFICFNKGLKKSKLKQNKNKKRIFNNKKSTYSKYNYNYEQNTVKTLSMNKSN